ncbi:MAG: prepilin peptidase [bacterium]|nr:prepilin peptidase [bacterium]
MIAPALVLAALVVWAAAGVRLAVTDYRSRILPTRLIRSTAGVVWVLYVAAALVEGAPDGLVGAAIGGAICGGALAVVHFAHPPSMGFGDVRLAALNGLLCGWWGWRAALAGLAAGFLVALPEAIVTLCREGRRASRPLGPYLVVGAGGVAVWSALTAGVVPFGGV